MVHAAGLPLHPTPLDPGQVVAGDPAVAAAELIADGLGVVGVWEHGPGTSTDVEADEVFVVLSGRATVRVEGGPTLELGPGDVGVLAAGDRTTWTVHETLRKGVSAPARLSTDPPGRVCPLRAGGQEPSGAGGTRDVVHRPQSGPDARRTSTRQGGVLARGAPHPLSLRLQPTCPSCGHGVAAHVLGCETRAMPVSPMLVTCREVDLMRVCRMACRPCRCAL